VFIQLACWKWQSGEWIKWSYNGEGFNFLRPQLIAGFFSFRIGLFLHVPIMLLAILGGIILFRKQPFQALIWVLYFVLNSWLIFSWWCWDYESSFGPRAFTEHLFFLLIPVVHFVVRYQKWLVVLCLGVVTINGGNRLNWFYWTQYSILCRNVVLLMRLDGILEFDEFFIGN
jgi:hypothetical protein